MAICPQCSDFLKPDTTQCPECGWGTPHPKAPKDRETHWSPPVPAFHDEPWRQQRRMTPEEIAPYIAELKAVVASPTTLDEDDPRTARYLEACRAKKATP